VARYSTRQDAPCPGQPQSVQELVSAFEDGQFPAWLDRIRILESWPWVSGVLRPRLFGLAGLAFAAPMAVAGDWSLMEFCWSTWLAGLLFTWLCVLTGGMQIVLTAPRWRVLLERRVPPLARLNGSTTRALTAAGATVLMALAFQAYTYAFGFYGLFLSFFAEMEPHALFGRNGFINSDFWTPVRYLAATFWAMSVGTIVAYGGGLVGTNPWKRMLLPLATEIVRVHLMVLLMPFLALLAWAALGESYESVVIVLLMTAFYLLPGRSRDAHTVAAQADPVPEHAGT
jgi:hypothetical protein